MSKAKDCGSSLKTLIDYLDEKASRRLLGVAYAQTARRGQPGPRQRCRWPWYEKRELQQSDKKRDLRRDASVGAECIERA